MEIFLGPGEFRFADAPRRLKTLLGSCVAVTFRDPRRHRGAMCHFLLPRRGAAPGQAHRQVEDGRYAEEVLPHILARFRREGTAPEDLEVKVFGGASMFTGPGPMGERSIGQNNILAAERILKEAGCRIAGEDVAGCLQRMVVFEVDTGAVWVRQGTRTCDRCERDPAAGCIHVRP